MAIKIVEFRNSKPFTVVIEVEHNWYSGYDFEWSKKYGCYLYHQSSSGPTPWTIMETEYWASNDAQFDIYLGRGQTHIEQFDTSGLFNDNIGGEGKYCSQCGDWLLGDDACVHLHWSDEAGYVVEVVYCCKELECDWFMDYDVDTKLINETDSNCPHCGQKPAVEDYN